MNNNFLVKKSLGFLPQASAPSSPTKGDVYKDANLDLLQYNGASWVKIGSGSGFGDLDTMYSETFDDASLADFTITGVGVSLDSAAPLNGTKSLKLIHQAAINQVVKRTISVPEKYRGQTMTVAVLAKSAATIGNVTILFRDETNTIDLQSSQQVQADSASRTFQFGVKIPSNCLSFSYTITVLPEAGTPATYIDDISIKAYWMGTSSQGQTSLTVPTIEQQSAYITGAIVSGPAANISGALTTAIGSGILSYNSGTGFFTVLKKCSVTANCSVKGASAASIRALILVDNNASGVQSAGATAGWYANASYSGILLPGQTIAWYADQQATNAVFCSLVAEAISTTQVISNDLVPAKAMNGSASMTVPTVTAWQTYSSPTVTATTTAPTKGAVVIDRMRYRQVGENWEVDFEYNHTTAGVAGSGDYIWTLPPNVTIDTSKVTPSSTASLYDKSLSFIGDGYIGYAGTGRGLLNVMAYSSNQFRVEALVNAASEGIVGTGMSPFTNANYYMKVRMVFPGAGLSNSESKTWSSTQTLVQQDLDSHLHVYGTNGTGTTGTFALRFGTLKEVQGNAITYTADSVFGDTFTVQKTGIYTFGLVIDVGTSNTVFGLSKNETTGALSSNWASVTDANRLTQNLYQTTANDVGSWGGSFYAVAGDVIRVRSSQTGASAVAIAVGNLYTAFTLSYQGSVKAIQTVSNQKIEIPTHELAFEGSSSRGSTDTAVLKFDSISKVRGDAFSILNTVANGTAITILKSGILNISASIYISTAVAEISITKNKTLLTSINPVSGQNLSTEYSAATGNVLNTSCSVSVIPGDVIRITGNANPNNTAPAYNQLSLFLQEQSVAVSVSNTLPQFSESDSCVRVTNTNGHGSTATAIRRFSNIMKNVGNDILYQDSATLGASFTILTEGTYHISYVDSWVAASQHGISLNQSNLTTGSSSLLANEILATITTGGANYEGNCAVSYYLNAGDIIRPATNAGTGTDSFITSFTITKIGKPNVTGVDVTPFIEVPQFVSGDARWSGYNGVSVVGGFSVFDTTDKMNGNGIFVADNTDGNGVKFLKRAVVTASIMKNSQVFNNSVNDVYVYLDGVIVAATRAGNGGSGNTDGATATFSAIVEAGQVLKFAYSATVPTYGDTFCKANLVAQATSDTVLTAPDTFSTDTANLIYASSSLYNLSTLPSAPIGTFITYSATGNNTLVQTTTAPTQSLSDMNQNGILLYGRTYAGTSTAALPSIVIIQIGKGHLGYDVNGFLSSGQVNSLVKQSRYVRSATAERGYKYGYNPKTGLLTVDICTAESAANTSFDFVGAEQTASGSNAYFTINASKNPALVGVNSNDIAARGVNSSGQIFGAAGSIITYNTAKTFDTNAALDTTTGYFTSPESGYYQVSAGLDFASAAYTGGQVVYIAGYKNGIAHSYGDTYRPTTVTIAVKLTYSDLVYLAKGETFGIFVLNSRGNTTSNADVNHNFFSIKKI